MTVVPTAAESQTMRETLNRLFVFSGSNEALFLSGSAGFSQTEVHGDHFIPSEAEGNGALIGFFNDAISDNVASFPLSSSVASRTFTFVGGVPTPTSESFGPIFAERAQTVGRGRFNVGFNLSRIRFSSLRGVPLDGVELTFVHQNSDFPGCDGIFGGDCTELGNPLFEHDRIVLDLDLDIEAEIYAFYATFGVHDRIDLGLAVPIVDLSITGTSAARLIPATGVPVSHFFSGSPDDPTLTVSGQTVGQTTGIGDVAVRAKGWITRSDISNLALLGEVRLPTGREEDFLGTGEPSFRGLFIASASMGDFSPHANLGYVNRGGDPDTDLVEVVAGFDHRLADWATLAVDVLGAFRLDDDVTFPEPVTIPGNYIEQVERVNVPDRRDDLVDGSLGFKLRTQSGLVVVANVLVPLNDGGLRAGVIPTLGVEYSP